MTMYRMKHLTGFFLPVALVLAPSIVPAQIGMLGAMVASGQSGQTVTGMGVASMSRQPDRLRMHIELTAKGENLEEALTQLKTRREAAMAQLELLKADMASINTGTPTKATGQSEQQRRMEQMIIPQLRARGQKIPPGLLAPQLASVSVTLSAEWPLAAETPEELLLRAETLRQQIQEADLNGSKEQEELSPEAQELAEEMAEMSFDDDSSVAEGEPIFLFVAHFSEADREKATADAFAKARKQAQTLARAAGVELGPLASLTGQSGGESDISDEYYDYEYRQYISRLVGRSMNGMPFGDDGETANEAISANAGEVSYRVMVSAAFSLVSPK